MAIIKDPRPVTRSELARFLPDQRSIKAFEDIFKLIPSEFNNIYDYLEAIKLKVIRVDGDYTAETANQIIIVDATASLITITLPDATELLPLDSPFTIGVSKFDTTPNIVRISPINSQTIVSEPYFDLLIDGEILNITTDNENWELAA